MSHKALPGTRGQPRTTAEQQLTPTTCSTLTAVTGGQAGPQGGIPNLAQRQLPGEAQAPGQPQCYRRHHVHCGRVKPSAGAPAMSSPSVYMSSQCTGFLTPEGILSCMPFINSLGRQRTNLNHLSSPRNMINGSYQTGTHSTCPSSTNVFSPSPV